MLINVMQSHLSIGYVEPSYNKWRAPVLCLTIFAIKVFFKQSSTLTRQTQESKNP